MGTLYLLALQLVMLLVHWRIYKIRECVGFVTDFKDAAVNNFMIDYATITLLYHGKAHTNYCILQHEFFCQFCLFRNRPDAVLATHHVLDDSESSVT
jgi:hypothetical protein